jgi:hypothetical protein
MGDRFLCDSLGMGEDLETVAAGDGGEGDAGGFGGADRQRRGGRDGDDQGAPMNAVF